MKFASLSLALLLVVSSAMAVAPVDNPVATMYGDSQYQWTNQVKWDHTFNILDYGGDNTGVNDNLSAFNAARDAANAAGGGVVYCPTGTYKFSDSIQLKDGVVVRGDNPTGITSAKTAGYAPPTKFEFPQFIFSTSNTQATNNTAFKGISSVDPMNDSNMGLVNIDVNRADIRLGINGLDAWWGSSSNPFGAPSQTSRASNIVVLGVRSNNVARPYYSMNASQNAWQVMGNIAVANIAVQPWKNSLVANNRCNDATTDNFDESGTASSGYKVKYNNVWQPIKNVNASAQAIFSYTDHYGIYVGRTGALPNVANGDPTQTPTQFRTGVDIRDNYVLTTQRVKIHAGGYGLNVKDNIADDVTGKVYWLDSYGGQKYQTNNSATYENRGIDLGGYGVTVSGNNYTVYSGRIAAGPYYSVDGEGVLYQNWTDTLVKDLTVKNNTGNAYIGLWFVNEIRGALIENNTLTGGSIYVNTDTGGIGGVYPGRPMYNVVVRNNTVPSITIRSQTYSNGTDGNEVTGNTTGSITYTTPNVYVHDNGSATLTQQTPAATQVNRGPDVAITSPTMWSSAGGTAANITVNATDDGSVTKVDFYTQNATTGMDLIGTDSNGGDGWSFNYSGLTYGADYMIAAKATDNSGNAYCSDPIYFTAVLAGDANKDRYTDVIDLGLLATSYGTSIGGRWGMGDFNGDGQIDVIDLGILATNYGHAATGADAGMLPEPLTLSLLGIGMVGLLRRK
jgi:hypothetical protein